MIKKGDSFFLNKASNSYPEVNDEISDITIDSFYMPPEPTEGKGVFRKSSMMLEYKVGEGFVDYDLVNHTSRIEGFDVDGKHKAFAFDSYVTSINNNLLFEASLDTLPTGYDPYNGTHSLAVIDGENDSLLFYQKLEDVTGSPTGFEDVVLKGDYLYVVSFSYSSYSFMNVAILDYLPNANFEKVVHKVNWRTNELIWTRHFGTIGGNDDVLDFRLIQDSMLILAIESNGYRYWEGERIDVPEDPDLGYDMAFYKLNTDGHLLDYIDIDTWENGFLGANIEDDGSVVVHGAQLYLNPITFGDTEMYVNSDFGDAILGYAPSDWNGIWMKSFTSEFFSGIYGANYSASDDELAVALIFRENITIEGTHFVASHAGEEENPNVGLPDNAFVIYDSSGNVKFTPAIFPLDINIYEVHKIADQHYLFYAFDRTSDIPEVFGTQLGENTNFLNRFIFEIQGEWLDIISSLDDLVNEFHSKAEIYPNPVSSGEWVNMNVESIGKDLEIAIVSPSGKSLVVNNYVQGNSVVKIRIPQLLTGIYTVTVRTKEKIYYSKLVIL